MVQEESGDSCGLHPDAVFLILFAAPPVVWRIEKEAGVAWGGELL